MFPFHSICGKADCLSSFFTRSPAEYMKNNEAIQYKSKIIENIRAAIGTKKIFQDSFKNSTPDFITAIVSLMRLHINININSKIRVTPQQVQARPLKT